MSCSEKIGSEKELEKVKQGGLFLVHNMLSQLSTILHIKNQTPFLCLVPWFKLMYGTVQSLLQTYTKHTKVEFKYLHRNCGTENF